MGVSKNSLILIVMADTDTSTESYWLMRQSTFVAMTVL